MRPFYKRETISKTTSLCKLRTQICFCNCCILKGVKQFLWAFFESFFLPLSHDIRADNYAYCIITLNRTASLSLHYDKHCLCYTRFRGSFFVFLAVHILIPFPLLHKLLGRWAIPSSTVHIHVTGTDLRRSFLKSNNKYHCRISIRRVIEKTFRFCSVLELIKLRAAIVYQGIAQSHKAKPSTTFDTDNIEYGEKIQKNTASYVGAGQIFDFSAL